MKRLLLILFIIMISLGITHSAYGQNATLYLLPSTGNYTLGSTFSVVVKVSSGGIPINAAEGALVFNTEELNVDSLSKSGSIFTLWTTEPTFSNSAGTIEFGGGTPSGFTGASGNILTITLKAKRSTTANLNFLSGSVLAADGKGTNVLATMNGGAYTLKTQITTPPAKEVPPEAVYTPPAAVGAVPAAPVVSSLTHPEPSQWYSNNSPVFSWDVPSGVTAVKLLLNKEPTTLPTNSYSPPISEKRLENLEDGIWYFHIRLKNKAGWGGITHRKVLIDTQPPEPFEIEIEDGGDRTNPSPVLRFQTKDTLSGVEYYEVKIGEAENNRIEVADIEHNPYKMPPRPPGTYTVLVKAVDKAENWTIATTDVKIEPIEAPLITEVPKQLRQGEILALKGSSKYPEATVNVFVKKQGEEAISRVTKTDSEGNWSFAYPKSLDKGTYEVWAAITDARGAKSQPSEKNTLAVTLPTLVRLGGVAISYLTIMATLIFLIAVLVGIIFYTYYRLSLWRKRLRKETGEVAENVRKAFNALREEVEEQVAALERKARLSQKEKAIKDKLKEALNISEAFISKEIKDVEKELE